MVDIYEVFDQKLLVLGGIVSPFVDGNVRAGIIKLRINNIVKFLYSLGPVL